MGSWQLTRIIAGSFILISLGLGVESSPLFLHSGWLFFTAFVGFNLLQSGVTKWCLMERLLRRCGLRAAE